MASLEKVTTDPETKRDTRELERIGEEKRQALREQLEVAEAKQEKSLRQARSEALEIASIKEPEQPTREISPAERRGALGKEARKAQHDASFDNQLEGARHDMSAPAKQFSRIIHNKAVEKASDTLGASVARPNALLFGSIFAFACVTIVFLIAKNYAYQLSGFETIAAFILGWLIGLLYDFLRLMFYGHNK